MNTPDKNEDTANNKKRSDVKIGIINILKADTPLPTPSINPEIVAKDFLLFFNYSFLPISAAIAPETSI